MGPSSLFSALALAAAVAHQSAEAAVWRLPLERHSVAAVNQARQVPVGSNESHARVWEPSFPNDQVTSQPVAHAPVDVTVRNIMGDLIHVTTVYLGSPPQPVTLSVNLATSEVLAINHKLDSHGFYDHTKSSTYQVNGTKINMQDLLYGFVSKDHITMGAADGAHIEVRDQLFVELAGKDSFLLSLPYDGLIGLGPQVSGSTGAPSFLRAMVDQGLLDQPVVGLHVGDQDAHLMFGGIDAKYEHGDITYFPNDHQNRIGWWVPLAGVSVDGKSIAGATGRALVQNGDFLAGPRDQVETLAKAVGVVDSVLPCDGPGPDITFQVGETIHVTLTKKEYAARAGQGKCMFVVFPMEYADLWILGTPFLRHVYTVLDLGASETEERVGLALAKN